MPNPIVRRRQAAASGSVDLSTLASGMVAAYKWEDANLGIDSTGRGNTLVNNGGASVTQTTGKIGFGGLFADLNDYMYLPGDSTDLSLGSTSWTVTLWAKPSTLASFHTLFGKWNSAASTGNEYLCFWHPTFSDLRLIASNDGSDAGITSVIFPAALAVGNWSFIVASFNLVTGQLSLNVNNSAAPATGSLSTTFDGTNEFEIGRNINGGEFKGVIDAFLVWKRILTANEIKALFNNAAGREGPVFV